MGASASGDCYCYILVNYHNEDNIKVDFTSAHKQGDNRDVYSRHGMRYGCMMAGGFMPEVELWILWSMI